LAATLPNLRPYLAYRASAPEDNSMGSNNQRRSRGRQGGKLKIAEVERLKTNLAAVKSLEEANCSLALQLLARVATRHKKLVFPSPAEKAEAATFWDHKKHLRLDIPMPDANVPVYLDPLLPTLRELVQAAGGTDRKTRTAAAELLHAVVVIMIGQTSAHTEEMEARGPMTELFKRVLPALLDLAADADSVVQGLFRPLFSQLIHWFTKARKYETPETVCLLNCLLDAVCDSERDAARRQEAAAYLGEFAEWSVRQAAGRTATGRHWRSILNRLYFLWRHPDPDKRSGACSAFDALYRRLREDEAVVGEHLLELLAAAMSGLRLAHTDSEGSEAAQLARLSLDHIKRILFHYLSRQGCVPVL
jgi:DNA-dependent protein kinase catalytic subunit